MIRVQAEPFDTAEELAGLQRRAAMAGAGGFASYVGLVRPQADADEVSSLELEHYPGFTERQIAAIADAASARFDLLACVVIHRFGVLHPGEAIVLAAAAARHRREAIEAVDYLMDRLKTEAPFWKCERRGATSEWIEPRADDVRARARWDETGDTPT